MSKKKAAAWIIIFALLIIGPRVISFFLGSFIKYRKYGKQAAGGETGAFPGKPAYLCIGIQQLL